MQEQPSDGANNEPGEPTTGATSREATTGADEVVARLPRFAMVASTLVPLLLLLGTGLGGLVAGSGPLTIMGAVFVAVAVGLALALYALPPTTLRFGPDGVRAKQPLRKELHVEWNAITGVRGARHLGVIDLLVVDVDPRWWNHSGVRRWNRRGQYSWAITVGQSHARLSELLVEIGHRAPWWVRLRQQPRRVSGVAAFAVAALTSLLCGMVLSSQLAVQLANREPPETPAADLPYAVDDCGGLEEATVRRLVPHGRETGDRRPVTDDEQSCERDVTAPSSPGPPSRDRPDAHLTVSVTRYGSTYQLTAEDEAREAYGSQREIASENDRLARLPGLGEEAFVLQSPTGLADAGEASVHVRRGSDLVSVSYSGQPVKPKRVADAAIVVARQVLKGLPR